MKEQSPQQKLNVLGSELQPCCSQHKTGFFRDGFCRTDEEDRGRHVICAQVTKEFLDFSVSQGNDLITPRPEFRFPGLQPGDFWCLCALRWKEAFDAGVAPRVDLTACDQSALEIIPLENLISMAITS